ncbi:ABC-2 type transport system permease protein [Entomortierella parvispora]|uniref:ABC-2 type transport system permease protein n=1 Tax=Entomortierella parvispora TaxID=205924 RepID=A0A9P3HF19_9FUNG|nr:ABC-2 type transport system permease protein [Entomortierella parvispora]
MPRRTSNSSNSSGSCSARNSPSDSTDTIAAPTADHPTTTAPFLRSPSVRPLGIDTVALTVQDPPREQDNGAPFFVSLDANNIDNKDAPFPNTPHSRPPSFSQYPRGDPGTTTATEPRPFSDFNVFAPGTSTSPKFRPIQVTVAPLSSESAHAQAEPLYHTTTLPPPPLAHTLSHAHSTNTHHRGQNGQAFQPYPSSVDPRAAQERDYYGRTITSSAGHTGGPSLGGAAAGTNIQSSRRSKRHHGDGGNRIRTSQHSARTQISGSSTAVGSRNSERLLSSSSSSTNSISSSHLSRAQHGSNSPSRKAVTQSRPSAKGPPAVPEPPATAPVSRKRFSLFRLPFATPNPVNEKAVGISSLAEPRPSVSWDSNVRQEDGQPTRPKRKTGVPGLNGEEPETNPFNFIDIMLDMPYSPTWREVWTKMGKALTILTLSYFTLMALYFGASFQSPSRLENMSVAVVDMDHSMIGNEFLNFTQKDNLLPGQINWSVQSYNNLSGVIADVENGNFWGAVVVRANASSQLMKALSVPLKDYDPRQAFYFIYDGGRDPLVVKPYIVASMYTQFLQFTAGFNPGWVSFVLNVVDSNNVTVKSLLDAPQVLGMPVAFEEMDLHPTTATIITSATSVAYIWIFLVAGGSTYLVAHIVQPVTRTASVRKTMVLLLGPLLVFLSSLSMAYSLLLLIFGVPFYSGAQFMSLFAGMLLLQSAVASLVLFLIFLIPVTVIPSITISFVVMNVIAVFNPVELMPGFYRWVYAMPFLNAVQIARYTLMGSYNRLNYNIPILFAWIIVPLTLLPFAIARQKRLRMEVMEAEEEHRRQQMNQQRRRYQQQQHRHHLYSHDPTYEDDEDYYYNEKAVDESGKRGERSQESERPRGGTSRHPAYASNHHPYQHQSHRSQRLESSDEDEDLSQDDDADDNIDNGFYGNGGDEERMAGDIYGSGMEDDDSEHRLQLEIEAVAQRIRPLHSRTLSGGPIPSAPPESQIFRRAPAQDRAHLDQPSYLEMPRLNRHPYAAELVAASQAASVDRTSTPNEVK